MRVLEGLVLDLCQGVQVNFVTCLFLRDCRGDEQQSRDRSSGLLEAVQIH